MVKGGEVGGGAYEGVADDHEGGAGERDEPGRERGVTHPAQHGGGEHGAQRHHEEGQSDLLDAERELELQELWESRLDGAYAVGAHSTGEERDQNPGHCHNLEDGQLRLRVLHVRELRMK